MRQHKVLGIDLGTTYSCVAYVNDYGKAEVIPNRDGKHITPSVVWFDGNHVHVGEEAKAMAVIYPTQVASFVKRHMGDETWFFPCSLGKLRPEEISSYILKKLVQDAWEYLGEEVRDVVITCPAYFFLKEREATREAGKRAGLNVLQIVNEPTAAAIASGFQNQSSQTKNVMVYDLGGGTFDVTLIQSSPQSIRVISTDGDHHLGGKDWDDHLIQIILRKFKDETGILSDLLNDPETACDLQKKAEAAKIRLSDVTSTEVSVTYGGTTARVMITREEFEQGTNGLLEKTILFSQEMLKTARKMGEDRIDEILLVGGSSRMPQVVRRLEEQFSMEPKMSDPDETVARGAALVGHHTMLRDWLQEIVQKKTGNENFALEAHSGTVRDAMEQVANESGFSLEAVTESLRKITNVASRSFGQRMLESDSPGSQERLFHLIYRNTPVPVEESMTGLTMEDDQRQAQVSIMASKRDKPSNPQEELDVLAGVDPVEGELLWEGDLELPPGMPKGTTIITTFVLDRDGLLQIHCREPQSGNELRHTIRTLGVLSKQEQAESDARQSSLIVD